MNLDKYEGKRNALISLGLITVLIICIVPAMDFVVAQTTRKTIDASNIVLTDDLNAALANATKTSSLPWDNITDTAPIGPYSFMISHFTNATATYYQATNGTDGKILDPWTTTNATTILQNSFTQAMLENGTVKIKAHTYPIDAPLTVAVIDTTSSFAIEGEVIGQVTEGTLSYPVGVVFQATNNFPSNSAILAYYRNGTILNTGAISIKNILFDGSETTATHIKGISTYTSTATGARPTGSKTLIENRFENLIFYKLWMGIAFDSDIGGPNQFDKLTFLLCGDDYGTSFLTKGAGTCYIGSMGFYSCGNIVMQIGNAWNQIDTIWVGDTDADTTILSLRNDYGSGSRTQIGKMIIWDENGHQAARIFSVAGADNHDKVFLDINSLQIGGYRGIPLVHFAGYKFQNSSIYIGNLNIEQAANTTSIFSTSGTPTIAYPASVIIGNLALEQRGYTFAIGTIPTGLNVKINFANSLPQSTFSPVNGTIYTLPYSVTYVTNTVGGLTDTTFNGVAINMGVVNSTLYVPAGGNFTAIWSGVQPLFQVIPH